MSRHHSFSAAVNRGIRAAAAAERAHMRSHAAHLREMERLRKAQVRAAREAFLFDRQATADLMTEEARNQVLAIEGLLTNSLALPRDVDFSPLRRIAVESDLDADAALVLGDAPAERDFRPPPLGWLSRLFAGARAKHDAALASGHMKLSEAQAAYDKRVETRRIAFSRLKDEVDEHNASLDSFEQSLADRDPESLVTYAELLLSATPLPEGFPGSYRVAILPSSNQLVVEFEVPTVDSAVPENESYRYVKQSNEISAKKRPVKARSGLYSSALAQVPLALTARLFRSDRLASIDSIALSGFVNTVDPGTGRDIRPCLISLRTTREDFSQLDLGKVEPVACLKSLKAVLSRSPAELMAVKPIINFDMVDPRFVTEQDVLSTLDARPNLIELTPSEFESLITNLFQSMGLDTKLTQASRDGGVDCVAFDPRPVLGGKVVVQAKRYRHTVGVSAVRDLFGTCTMRALLKAS